MISSFLTRGLVMLFGYAYPAYECYKCVEQNKPDIEQLLFWCKYWILVALLTVGERIGDAFISWVPMYSEAKLAFIIYLWFPKTKGTTYVYGSFFRPYLARHETEIDRNLMELKIRVGDLAVDSFQKVATYSQTRIFDILQYIAAQSVPTPRPVQRQQGGSRVRRPTPVAIQPPANTTRPQTEDLPSPSSSTSSTQDPDYEEEAEDEYVVLTEVPKSASSTALTSKKDGKSAPNASVAGTSTNALQAASSSEKEAIQIDPTSSSSEPQGSNPAPTQTVMEETLRETRARIRRNQTAVNC